MVKNLPVNAGDTGLISVQENPTCQGAAKPHAREQPSLCTTIEPKLGSLGVTAAAAAKSLQSCPALCDPTDGSPPGSPVPGILQARTLEWVAISFSSA